MNDSITVRVGLDSYDFVHPSEKQTAVHVQIPEVARATYLLPAEMFHGLTDRAWPEVLDVAHQYVADSGMVSDSASTAARSAIRAWLLEDPNRDGLQAAWEEDQASRNPVTRKLMRDNEHLLARVAELEKANAGLDDLRIRAIDKVEKIRVRLDEVERAYTFDTAELKREQDVLKERLHRAAMVQVWKNEDGKRFVFVEDLAPALLGELTGDLSLTVFRASHDSIVMGHYTTREAAQAHCESKVRQEEPEGSIRHLSWSADDIGPEAEYELHITPAETGGLIRGTGYVVTPLEVSSAYDPDGDE
ncbi:hypothetical protein ACFYOF_16565 [Streptomyces sp. NPDC007148]|uniref:hypothetical protein n=1 Tax=Streptomyces sp. NPDC007148 TaxID=3364775 RepID=UPI0036B1549D